MLDNFYTLVVSQLVSGPESKRQRIHWGYPQFPNARKYRSQSSAGNHIFKLQRLRVRIQNKRPGKLTSIANPLRDSTRTHVAQKDHYFEKTLTTYFAVLTNYLKN